MDVGAAASKRNFMNKISIYLGLGMALAASPCRAELQDENILAKLPTGFKIDFQQRNKTMLISEMVPVKQSAKNWTEMVTIQVFYGLMVTPEQFKARIEKELTTACPGAEFASCRRRSRERLSLPGLVAELPDQQSDGQARNHLVQGDSGQ